MKRIISALFTIILSVILCCSCNQTPEDVDIQVLELGGFSDTVVSADHKCEYAPWSDNSIGMHSDAGASEKIVVTFLGETYSGEYQYSTVSKYATYKTDTYNGTDGAPIIRINHDTGELVSITINDSEDLSQQDTYSESECIATAQKTAEMYIRAPLSEYTLSVEHRPFFYAVSYQRYFGDLKTNEGMTICVSHITGKVVQMSSIMLNAYNTEDIKTHQENVDILSKHAGGKVEEKVKSIYAESPEYKTYNVNERFLCKLPDGGYGIVYNISSKLEYTKIENENGNTEEIKSNGGERFYVLTKLDTVG